MTFTFESNSQHVKYQTHTHTETYIVDQLLCLVYMLFPSITELAPSNEHHQAKSAAVFIAHGNKNIAKLIRLLHLPADDKSCIDTLNTAVAVALNRT